MNRKIVVVAFVVFAIAIILSSLVFVIFINKPRPNITSTNGYLLFEGVEGAVYYVVNASVKNDGIDGWIKICAELNLTGKYETKRIYVASGQTSSLEFQFDITVWKSLGNPIADISHRVWANAD